MPRPDVALGHDFNIPAKFATLKLGLTLAQLFVRLLLDIIYIALQKTVLVETPFMDVVHSIYCIPTLISTTEVHH